MSIQNILSRLNHVRRTGENDWRCQCPCDHRSHSQMTIKELPDGRILIHCFAGHSPTEIMDAIDMRLSDLFEEAIEDRIRPLYMARKEKKRYQEKEDRIGRCELRLDLAKSMRDKGIKLTDEDMRVERYAYQEKKRLTLLNNE